MGGGQADRETPGEFKSQIGEEVRDDLDQLF